MVGQVQEYFIHPEQAFPRRDSIRRCRFETIIYSNSVLVENVPIKLVRSISLVHSQHSSPELVSHAEALEEVAQVDGPGARSIQLVKGNKSFCTEIRHSHLPLSESFRLANGFEIFQYVLPLPLWQHHEDTRETTVPDKSLLEMN